MKKACLRTAGAILLAAGLGMNTCAGETMKILRENIHWLGHACFRVEAGKVFYFDPYELKDGMSKADVVFVTHSHYDHCSPMDLRKICTPNTILYCTPDCNVEDVEGEVVRVEPGKSYPGIGYHVRTVPAYNIGKAFHPKEKNWVGYVLDVDGSILYHPGDTDHIPEMKGLKADFALMPVGGKYTMNAEEAAAAFKEMDVDVGIPMHYGSIVGSEEDAKRFLELIGK